MSDTLPNGYVAYGSDSNCTMSTCPVSTSVYGYQPSIGANVTFIALFSVFMALHIFQGIWFRSWWYMCCIACGCIAEIIGYAGRVQLHNNPFAFNPFIMQIVTITIAPIFFCAAIYVVLGKTIDYLDVSLARFRPGLLAWIFIPCDVVSLILQAVGGAMSSTTVGSSQNGVDISLAGLSLQVATLTAFCALAGDYAVRFCGKHRQARDIVWQLVDVKFKIFIAFTTSAIILILIRCCYRIDELSNGYSGDTFQNQGLFIALEGAIMATAVLCLNIGHPGPVFYQRSPLTKVVEKQISDNSSEHTAQSEATV